MTVPPAALHLDWPNCLNARDLGGLAITGGGRIRERALVRTDPHNETLTLAEIYLAMLDLRPKLFAAVMAAVADAPDGAVVVHCAGGKDRTGMIVAMALS